MKHEISAEQIANYRDNGFLVIENFLDDEELQTWRTTTDEAVAQRLENTRAQKNKPGNGESYYSQVFTQCVRLADTHAGMHDLMFDARLGEVAGTLAGVEGIRIWHDQALIKPPYGNPTSWHLDNPYWSFTSRNSLSLWVALDDATLSNGCLWYLPGTHKLARDDNAGIGENMRDIFKFYPEWERIEAVATPCAAGGAVFHNGLTAHSAGANMTNRPRRAMTCGYMPDGSTFNGKRNILPAEMFNSLQIGDALVDDEQNPLIWKQQAV